MLVSVLIPVYNASAFIRQSVSSILNQSYNKIEVIAINDGSTDDSLQILQALSKSDARLAVHSHGNMGIIKTLNAAIPLARGDLIARMDADDVSHPGRIALQVQAFRDRPDLMLCGSDHHVIFEGDRVEQPDYPCQVLNANQLRLVSMFYPPFSHPSAMFHRSVFEEHGFRYDEKYRHAEDFDLFARIMRRHRSHRIPQKLIAIRRFGESVMTRHYWEMRRAHYRIVAENLSTFGVAADVASLVEAVQEQQPLDREHVHRIAQCVADVRNHGASLEGAAREGYECGYTGLFSHVLETVRMLAGEEGVKNFLDVTGEWQRLRRRERYMISAHRWLPAQIPAAARRLDIAQTRRRSVPLDRVLPTHAGTN